QAEDGIRYRNVTGVQTCALPISCIRGRIGPRRTPDRRLVDINDFVKLLQPQNLFMLSRDRSCMIEHFCKLFVQDFIDQRTFSRRSEERRVGKESRRRWSLK